MSVDKLALQITTDTSQTEKSIGSIRTELRQATQDAVALARKFGDFSPEALGAAQKVANLKDEIGDLKSRIDSLNPDRKFQAFSQSLQGVAGGFAGLQGAIGLFGTESKDLEKQLLKVQSALALSEGLNAILESKDAFKNMGNVAVKAFQSIKTAIGSTGIGLLVVALGTIYAYWDDIKGAVSGVSEEQKKLNRDSAKGLETEKDKLTAVSSQDNILKLQGKSEKDILKIKMKQTDEVIRASEIQIENQIATNRAAVQAAKRNKEILEGIIQIVAYPLTMILKTVDAVGAAVGKNLNLEKGFLNFTSSLVFDPEQVANDGEAVLKEQRATLAKLKNDRAGFQLQLQELEKPKGSGGGGKAKVSPEQEQAIKEAKDKKEAFEKGQQEIQALNDAAKEQNRLAALSDFEREMEQLTTQYNEKLAKAKEFNTNIDAVTEEYNRKKEELQKAQDVKDFEAQILKDQEAIAKTENDFANDLAILDAQRQAIVNNTALTEEQRTKLLDENSKARMSIEDAEKAHKEKQVQAYMTLISDLGDVVGRETVAGKALAIAGATMDTYQAANKALDADYGIFGPVAQVARFAAVAATIARGIKNVKQIASVKVPGGGGGGGNLPSGAGGAAGAAAMQAPIAQAVQIQQTALTPGGNGVSLQNQSAVKAFVVESDITDSQDRVAKIKAAATI